MHTRGYSWILKLSPTALAILMVIRDVQQAQDQPRYANRQRHDSCYLSWDTWTLASKELASQDLLEITRAPQEGDFDHQRMREPLPYQRGTSTKPANLVIPSIRSRVVSERPHIPLVPYERKGTVNLVADAGFWGSLGQDGVAVAL